MTFPDAMREYGVVDAIYITGGNSYLFHRDSNGNVCMTDNTRSKISKYSESAPPAPLLVFARISVRDFAHDVNNVK